MDSFLCFLPSDEIETMEGGDLLTQGAYGCIFDKPLKCKGKQQKGVKKGIAKLTEEIDAKQELAIAKILRKAPLTTNYFILANPESCEPKPEAKQTEEDIDKCQVLDRVSIADMRQIYMPWGGQVLYDVNTHPKQFNLLRFMIHMLEAVGTMTLHGVCHFDLHPGNIVVDANKTPRIIDYGMAFQGPNVTAQTVQFRWKVLKFGTPAKSQHWISNQEPPEITAINAYANSGYDIKTAIEEVVFTKDIFAQMARPFLGIPRSSNVKEFLEFWNTSKVCQQKQWVEFFRLYWTGFDSWSLGTIFLTFLIQQTFFLSFTESDLWKNHQVQIQTTLRGLLEINPRKRLDAIEALAILDPGNAWIKRFASGWLDARMKQKQGQAD